MANQMWMGIPYSHAQWVPCPSIDSSITRNRYIERIQFENGGGDIARSPQYQMQYDINTSGLAHEVDGIDAYNRFASGLYGDGYIYLAYPAHFDTNIFSAQWSTPALSGWTNSIYRTGYVVDTPGDIVYRNNIVRPNFENGIPSTWTTIVGTGVTSSLYTGYATPGNTKSLRVDYTASSDGGISYTFNIPSSGDVGTNVFECLIFGYIVSAVAVDIDVRVSLLDNSDDVISSYSAITSCAGNVNELLSSVSIDKETYPDIAKVVVEIHRDETSSDPLQMHINNTTLLVTLGNGPGTSLGIDGNYPTASYAEGVVVSYDWEGATNNSTSVLVYKAIPSNANLPKKSMTFYIDGTANNVPNEKFTIAIPPKHYLVYGITGSSTGSGKVVAREIALDGSYADSTVPFVSVNSTSGRMNSQIYGGDNGRFVQFFLSKTASEPESRITLTGLMARMTTSSAQVTSYLADNVFVMGEGSTGLQFADEAIVETYSYMHPPRKGISTSLVEVEAWR